jgi:undecaprenyl phosphate-alpha-L-ara4N flippase subunit ArnF
VTSRRWLGAGLLGSSIVLSAAGQLSMKVGMQELRAISDAAPAAAWLTPIAWTVGGLACYGCSLLAWLAVLVRYPLSFAYPMLSLGYVLVYWGATHWSRLLEPATPLRTAGTLLILVGVVLVSTTNRRDAAAANEDA